MVIESGELSPNTARLTACRASDIVVVGEKGGFKFLYAPAPAWIRRRLKWAGEWIRLLWGCTRRRAALPPIGLIHHPIQFGAASTPKPKTCQSNRYLVGPLTGFPSSANSLALCSARTFCIFQNSRHHPPRAKLFGPLICRPSVVSCDA